MKDNTKTLWMVQAHIIHYYGAGGAHIQPALRCMEHFPIMNTPRAKLPGLPQSPSLQPSVPGSPVALAALDDAVLDHGA